MSMLYDNSSGGAYRFPQHEQPVVNSNMEAKIVIMVAPNKIQICELKWSDQSTWN